MKKLLFAGIFLFVFAAQAKVGYLNYLVDLASGVTSTGAQQSMTLLPGAKTVQATLCTSSGAGSATLKIQGSDDGSGWDDLATLSLSGTAVCPAQISDSVTMLASAYLNYRVNATAISGTGATARVQVGG